MQVHQRELAHIPHGHPMRSPSRGSAFPRRPGHHSLKVAGGVMFPGRRARCSAGERSGPGVALSRASGSRARRTSVPVQRLAGGRGRRRGLRTANAGGSRVEDRGSRTGGRRRGQIASIAIPTARPFPFSGEMDRDGESGIRCGMFPIVGPFPKLRHHPQRGLPIARRPC